MQSQVQHVPEKVPGEGLGGFGAEPSQVQQHSGEGSSAWLRSMLQKGLQKYNVAAVGDTTEGLFIFSYIGNSHPN